MKKNQKKGFKQSREDQLTEIAALGKRINELNKLDPKTLEWFNELPLSRATLKALKTCKYLEPTLVQKLSLPHALLGKDVVVDAKTGSGKTLAFAIPLVERLFHNKWHRSSGVGALIITPTRELAYQIHAVLKRLIEHHNLTLALVIGGQDFEKERHFMSCFNIIVCTPGRLHQHIQETNDFDLTSLMALVLDEADLCLSMGFADNMNDILAALPKSRQTMLFSATQTRDVQTLIKSGCKKPIFISLHEHSTASTPLTLTQSYTVCEAHAKLNFLFSFLTNHKKKKILVFVSTCKQAKFLSYVFTLLKLHMNILCLHGGMKQPKRQEIYDNFLKNQRIVLIATDIAARGLDFRGIDWVVQLDCPEDVTTYIHRVGRTARYYREGEALLVLTPHESTPMLKHLQQRKVPLLELQVLPGMITSQERRVEDLVCKDPTVMLDAQKAFQAYLKNHLYMKDKTIFDVTTVDRDRLARSYGLVSTPRVRFVERALSKIRQNSVKNAARVGAVESTADSDEANSVHSDDDDNTSPVTAAAEHSNRTDGGEAVDNTGASTRANFKNNAIKQVTIKADQCHLADHFNEIFQTVSELSGPLALPPTDYSKYLATGKKKTGDAEHQTLETWSEDGQAWNSLEEARNIVMESMKNLQLAHKDKLRNRKKALLKKRDEKRRADRGQSSAAKDDTVDCELDGDDDSESEVDEHTQQLIDELPDPDEVLARERGEQQDNDAAPSPEKTASKRKREYSNKRKSKRHRQETAVEEREESSDEGFDPKELKLLSIEEQEQLALRLLQG